jgi:hypothetical protein
MQPALYAFEAHKQAFDSMLILALGLSFLGIVGIFFIKRTAQIDNLRKNLLVMLFSFLSVIALGVAILRLYSRYKLQAVEIYNDKIITPYGTARIIEIEDFFIKIETPNSIVKTQAAKDSTRYLFIVEKNLKTHVLSEGDYAIDSIFESLEKVWEE